MTKLGVEQLIYNFAQLPLRGLGGLFVIPEESQQLLLSDYWDASPPTPEGKTEGEQIGLKKGKIEIILNGHNNRFSISQLALLTNLTEEEVILILKENGIAN